MPSDARMIGTTGSSATEIINLEPRWISSMSEMGFGTRIADVGQPCLTTVAILSFVEAKQVNESYRVFTQPGSNSELAFRPLMSGSTGCGHYAFRARFSALSHAATLEASKGRLVSCS
jgi:hypothetical protein